MSKHDFSDVLVYLCDAQTHIRKDVRAALTGYGFRLIEDCKGYDELIDKFEADTPDLLICDADLPDGDPIELARRLRLRDFGDNPFIPIIFLTWRPTPEAVKRMTNAGIDDLLGKPISPAKLMERIVILVQARKPFVVTADYIGPDRRKSKDRPNSVLSMEVPNTLRALALNEAIPDVSSAIDTAWSAIAAERQARNAFQLAFLVDIVLPRLMTGEIDEEVEQMVDKMVSVCEDTAKRLRSTGSQQAADLVMRMRQVTRAIRANPAAPGRRNIELLKPLAQAIHKAMNPNKDEAVLAQEISGALAGFNKRREANSAAAIDAAASQ